MAADLILTALALALAAASLGLLLIAASRPSGRVRLVAFAVTVIAALTAAQPMGVVARPTTATANGGTAESTTAIHRLGLFAFRLYRRPTFRLEGETGDPTHTLRLRTGLWPALLAHQTRLSDLCGSIDKPCWEPGNPSEGLSLTRLGARHWRLTAPTGYAATDAPPRPPDVPAALAWDLHIGLVSWPALVWWVAATILVGVIEMRRRRTDNHTDQVSV